jgi:hypothetical protein
MAVLGIIMASGIPLAALYVLTRRLWASIGYHTGWNFTEAYVFGAQVSGTGAGASLYQVQPVPGVDTLWSGGAFGPARSAYYFFIVIIVIGHKTLAAARWALLLIVRAFFNDAITVTVWTGLHVCLPMDTSASRTTVRIDRAETVHVLLKIVQCFFAKQVRLCLTRVGKFNDLGGDNLVSNRVFTPIVKRGADHLVRYTHNPYGLQLTSSRGSLL